MSGPFALWYVLVYCAAIAGAWSVATVVFVLARVRRRRQLRPNWARMLADTDYFQQAMIRILETRGYRVTRSWLTTNPIERQQREVVLALSRRGLPQVALCGRWLIPLTPEIMTRYEEALTQTQAQRGLIITTSHFTEAARHRAAELPVELVDGAQLRRWIGEN